MSGIDEVRMESCQVCIDKVQNPANITDILHHQYWTIRSRYGDSLAYYNPDVFRAKDGRLDKVNPANKNREQMANNPDKFVESICLFVCERCNDRITEEHPEFETMKSLVYNFISGDVFPYLDGRR